MDYKTTNDRVDLPSQRVRKSYESCWLCSRSKRNSQDPDSGVAEPKWTSERGQQWPTARSVSLWCPSLSSLLIDVVRIIMWCYLGLQEKLVWESPEAVQLTWSEQQALAGLHPSLWNAGPHRTAAVPERGRVIKLLCFSVVETCSWHRWYFW